MPFGHELARRRRVCSSSITGHGSHTASNYGSHGLACIRPEERRGVLFEIGTWRRRLAGLRARESGRRGERGVEVEVEEFNLLGCWCFFVDSCMLCLVLSAGIVNIDVMWFSLHGDYFNRVSHYYFVFLPSYLLCSRDSRQLSLVFPKFNTEGVSLGSSSSQQNRVNFPLSPRVSRKKEKREYICRKWGIHRYNIDIISIYEGELRTRHVGHGTVSWLIADPERSQPSEETNGH